MNKIVLNYIQEELGTEAKPLWTEIDEKAFETAISDIDLRQFPNLNYEQFKDLAFEQLYQTAETEILESAFDLVDGFVEKFERGGVIRFEEGGSTVTTGTPKSDVKSKTLTSSEMLGLLESQSTGNTRKDNKGKAAIRKMIADNPNATFTVFSDGRIDVSGVSDWHQGAGTGKSFANRPSLLDRISRGGENKAQRLYQELANSIASGKQTDLFKEEPKKEETTSGLSDQQREIYEASREGYEAGLAQGKQGSTSTEDQKPKEDKKPEDKKKQGGGGSGKGKVSGGKNLARLTAANKAYESMSANDQMAVYNLAKQKEKTDGNMYWINAVEEYLTNKTKGEPEFAKTPTEEDIAKSSDPLQIQKFASKVPTGTSNTATNIDPKTDKGVVEGVIMTLGGLYGAKKIMDNKDLIVSTVKDLAKKGLSGKDLVAAAVAKFKSMFKGKSTTQPPVEKPKLLGEGKKQSTQSSSDNAGAVSNEPVIVTPEPKKQEVLLLPEGRKQLPGYGEPATKKQNEIEGEYSPQVESKKSDTTSKTGKSKGLTFKQFLTKEGLVETGNPNRPYRSKSGAVAYTKEQVMRKFEAAKTATPKAKYGMLIPKPRTQILQIGGVVRMAKPLSTAKDTIEKGKTAVKNAAKEYGSDAVIGLAQGLMGGSRKAENTNLNNALEVASMLPVVGVPAQIANSLYRTKQEYDAGDLDWKDIAGELSDIGMSFIPGGKAAKGAVKLAKKPGIIKKLIS